MQRYPDEPRVWMAGLQASDLVDMTDDPAVVARGGWWAAVVEFDGRARFWRFARIEASPAPTPLPGASSRWVPPDPEAWRSSLTREAYLAAVHEVRRRIREGEVYQVNVCRVLRAPVDPAADPWVLGARLAAVHPAPHGAVLDLPSWPGAEAEGPVRIVSASPELSLRRDGDRVVSSPIKGTAPTAAGLLAKDRAENVMIVDLVRHDLHGVCRPGTVAVTELLGVHAHPGLVHLVSTVEGRLRPDVGWPELLAAVLPAGSVSGAPKSTALRAIADLEPAPRGPYCGAIGFIDADADRCELAVGIRTFWWRAGELCFGTGAGITWGSDAAAEWDETVLKASRLLELAGWA